MDPRIIRVTFPDTFNNIFQESIESYNAQRATIGYGELGFKNLEELRKIITRRLESKSLCNYKKLSAQFDLPYHLPGGKQTDILYINAEMEAFLEILVDKVIEKCKGSPIKIEQLVKGGRMTRSKKRNHKTNKRRKVSHKY